MERLCCSVARVIGSIWLPIGLMIAGVATLITFLVMAINNSNHYEAQFTKQCNAAGGKPMFTRDMDFCLNGNQILFMNN